MRSGLTLLAAIGCTGGAASPDAGSVATSDGAAPVVVDAPDAAASGTDAPSDGPITITVIVSGSGRVISEPAGIDCTTACAAFFPRGEPVTLTAMPIEGWLFEGFDEACTGAGPCTISGDADAVVQAGFIGDGSDLWIRRIVSSSSDGAIRGVAVDAFGDVAVSGYTYGMVDFGDGEQMSTGTFVARYASDGSLDWLRDVATLGVSGRPVAVDASGNVLAIGLSGVVAKLSVVDGSTMWSATVPATGQARAVAVTPSGDVVVAGSYRMTIDFGDGPRTGAYTGSVFAARFAGSDGALLWGATLFEDYYMAGAMDVAVDSGGNVVVAGYAQPSGSAAVHPDAFLARFLADDGTLDWSLELGGNQYDLAYSVAVAAGDDVIVTGSFAGSVDFGGGALESTVGGYGPSSDGFLARYTSAGAHVWSRAIGGYGADAGRSLAMLAGDVVMIAGSFQNVVRFGTTSVSDRASAGERDAFVAAYDAGGAYVTCATFGGTGDDEALAIGSSVAGAALGGTFDGTIDLAGVSYTSTGEQDLVLIATSAPPLDDTDL
jgi:hypothetical protein